LATATAGYLRIIHKGWRAGDGAATVFIELLGSEKVIEAKRAKRAEVRTKRQEEVRKQMEEQQQAAGAEKGPDDEEKKIAGYFRYFQTRLQSLGRVCFFVAHPGCRGPLCAHQQDLVITVSVSHTSSP